MERSRDSGKLLHILSFSGPFLAYGLRVFSHITAMLSEKEFERYTKGVDRVTSEAHNMIIPKTTYSMSFQCDVASNALKASSFSRYTWG